MYYFIFTAADFDLSTVDLQLNKLYSGGFCKEHPRYYCFKADNDQCFINPFMFRASYLRYTIKKVGRGYNTKLGKIFYGV